MISLRSMSLLFLTLVVGCSPAPQPPPAEMPGSVQIVVSASQALVADELRRVTVTTSAVDVPAITLELVLTGGTWGGVIGNIPAGVNRTFVAQAFDAAGVRRYEGRVEGVTITAGKLTLVTLTLQATASPPYANEAPVIDAVVASPVVVAPGGQVALTANAHDPNPGDTLTISWTASAGGFANPTALSTTWTAPSASGPVLLKLSVRDSSGSTSSVTLEVRVSTGEGGAVMDVKFNHPPKVLVITSSESNLAVGQRTTLTVSATDPDGDPLGYEWSATCAGTFDAGATASARFTPTASPSGACNNCQLRVSVSDGRGGQTLGTHALCVSKEAVHAQPPTLLRSYQSSLTATPHQVLTFEVVASDPQDAALTFSWSTSGGTFGTPSTGATDSRTSWTAPACVSGSVIPTVTATVTNAFNLSTTRDFTVSGLPTCATSGWVAARPMKTPRLGHTATLLPNGKVLVAGGEYYATRTAEVYDPATDTWSSTGSMATPRYGHSAVLLPSGKVLVVGGKSGETAYATAELYDPAAGTWVGAGAMTTARFMLGATVLPGGKVLVAGGLDGTEPVATAELYDPATNTWSSTGAMASKRQAHAAVLLPDGQVLVIGGRSSSTTYLKTAELYDPTSGTWRGTGSMATARYSGRATALPDGKVFIAGGYDGSQYLMTTELYHPASGTWTATRSMGAERSAYTTTLLPNGKLLAVGGLNNSSARHATAELYEPTSGTWSDAGSMPSARYWHTATLLPDGRVLVVGGGVGSDITGGMTASALYTP